MKVNLNARKILLVEDYPIMRTAIKEMLYQLKAKTIIETENAALALAAMEKEKFDIVLCDYNLGTGKNGQQLLEEAKYRKLLPFTSIFIMVTAEQTQSMVLSAMDNKPDDYLTKPFNAQQLISRIEKHFQRKAYLADIEKAIEKGNLVSAITHCENLLQLNDPGMRAPLFKIRAELAIKVGDLATANQLYQEMLQQRELAWARHGLGVIAFLQNNFELAIQHFQRVLNDTPMMMESYDWLAKAYEITGKRDEAKGVLLNAVELSPQAILRQQKLATLADKLDDLNIAKQAYKSAIKLSQYSMHKSSGDFSGLARVYCKTKDPKEALKTIAALRKEFQNDPEAELRAAAQEVEIYTAQGNQTLSAEAYAKIHKFSAQVTDIPKDLALDVAKTHYLNGNTEAANEMLNHLVKNNIDDEPFINELRDMYKAVGHDDQVEDLIQCTKQELIDINNKGVSLFKQGKLTEAIALLDAASEKMPDNKTILMNIATILIQDMKRNGITKEKLLKTNNCIKKATSLGAALDRVGNIRMEFTKLTHSPVN